MRLNKPALALAVAMAIPATTFAATDSNVTLYGIGTVGIEYTTNGDQWATKFQDYGSRIGLKGADRLNANNSVIWRIENRVNLGEGNGKWGGREAWVGYENDALGTMRFGHGKNQFELMVNEFDTFNGNSTLANTFNNSWSTRYNNAIFYDSPSWSGFNIGVAYSTDGSKTQTDQPNAEKYTAVASYKHSKFAVYAGYEQENNVSLGSLNGFPDQDDSTVIKGGQSRVRNFAVGAQVFPVEGMMVGLLYKNTDLRTAGRKEWSRDATMLVGQYETGNFTPRLGWVHQFKSKNKQGGSDIDAANMYIAGLDYKLSKRTYLFAEYSYIDNNDQNKFPTTSDAYENMNATGTTYKNPQGLALGIVTSF